MTTLQRIPSLAILLLANLSLAAAWQAAPAGRDEEIAQLRRRIAEQQTAIEELRKTLEEQSRVVASLAAAAPASQAETPVAAPVASPQANTVSASAVVARTSQAAEKSAVSLGGFQFSGDFRLRGDLQSRSGNEVAGPLQNLRGRYRVRINVDKEIESNLRFHLQLSTGPYNNALTNDQDMAGTVAKHPFSISEAWVDYRPNGSIALRAGRMEEVFADHSRFLWDDDVRFNGFQQTVKLGLPANPLGLNHLELRAGEYLLTNPAVYVLTPNSPYVAAGYAAGQKVRSSNLFHPGLVLRGELNRAWNHQISGDIQLYRNPDQIQLASTSNGYPVLINNSLGLVLSGPVGGAGNATTTPGGALYSARNFQIARLGYRLERKNIQVANREMPAWVDFQTSRNLGTSRMRNAWMISGNLGSVRQAGDLRFLYQFAVKDANSMISQFTDDDLGTGSGVNVQVQGFRFDIGLSRHVQIQNLLFLQRQRSASDPEHQFFVPLAQGANLTLRYLAQLAFSF